MKSLTPALAKNNLWIFFLISFLIWIYCFRGFLFGHLSLTSDALAYYEHFKFYFDQLSRGVYPQWEPTRDTGVPIEFFLRRIGSFNPLIFFILLVHKIGFSFKTAYFSFLAAYYFLGMIGFYKLARIIFGHPVIAFTAYFLLMFSSLSTRLFDSYILLTCVPMVWFFYFLFAFAQDQKRHTFLGMTFTLMVLFTTYIPFYFLIILFSFLFFYALLYFKEAQRTITNFFEFIKKNKLFVFLCLIVFLLSLIPGILFFQESGGGELSLPNRHYNSEEKSAIAVDFRTVDQWGLEEDLMYSYAFHDLKDFKFAIIYVPAFIFILLALGFFNPLNKRLVLLFFWGLSLLIVFSHHGLLYPWAYKHIPLFKYFRNLHFFLWMVLLPIFILFAVEQWRMFVISLEEGKLHIRGRTPLIVGVHALLVSYLFLHKDTLVSTYLTLILSFVFFLLLDRGVLKIRGQLSLIFILFLIVLQPIEVYHYLARNSVAFNKYYPYDRPYLKMALPTQSVKEVTLNSKNVLSTQNNGQVLEEHDPPNYMSLKWVDPLYLNLRYDILTPYLNSKVTLYDRVERMRDEELDLEKVGRYFDGNKNMAFIAEEVVIPPGVIGNPDPTPEIITDDSSFVKVVKFDVNEVTLKTDLTATRFLVYNDSYHSGWKAFIDGQKTRIYRANVGFKGVWVPAGEHVLKFAFGEPWRYGLNFILIFVFWGIFISLIYLWIKFKTTPPS